MKNRAAYPSWAADYIWYTLLESELESEYINVMSWSFQKLFDWLSLQLISMPGWARNHDTIHLITNDQRN